MTFRNAPTVYNLKRLVEIVYNREDSCMSYDETTNEWVPARPLGFYSFRERVKAAWLVFTGKADAVVWPGEQ